MLVFSRRTRQSVVVGEIDGFARVLRITVLGIRAGRVRLGLEVEGAPGVGGPRPRRRGLVEDPPGRPAPSNETLDRWADDGGGAAVATVPPDALHEEAPTFAEARDGE